MRKILSLIAAILFAGSMMATQETIFTYNGKGVTDAESIVKAGGTLTVYGQNTNIVADQKQKGNMCIKINKGYSKDGIYYYMAITLDEPLQAGDQIQTAAFRTGSNSCVYGMDFNAVADSASASDACQVLFPDNLQILSSNGVPVDTTFTIPEEAAGARFIRLYRKSGSTGLWIANFTILRGEGGGDDPQPEPQPLANGYYLVGDFAGEAAWAPVAERMFSANPDNEAEMVLANVALAVEDSLKVVYVENDAIVTWYPVDAPNYVVDAAHAGEKDIYFRADGQGGDDWYYHTIYIAENVEPQPEPVLANGYYLVGDFAGEAAWAPVAERMFSANPDNEAEMVLANVALAVEDSLKVVYVENDAIVTWYPVDAPNYVVDAAHAGEKAIYFRADGQGGDDWYYHTIYIAENVEPEPVDPNQMYIWNGIGTTTAEEAIELGGAAEAVQPSGENIVIGIAQKGNWCIKINKKFDNGNYYAGVALDNAVNAGDTLKVAYFRTGASSTYVMGVDFSADKASVATTYQILTEGDPQVLESAGTPEETIFIIPEGVANAKYIRFYRNSGSTGVWIAKIAIAKKSGETPEPQPEPELANGYYLVGDFAGEAAWAPVAERMFSANPDNEAEMVLANVALAVEDSLKVVYVENDAIVTWYPVDAPNYVVDAAHAGEKAIYFRADGQGGDDWYYHTIYIAENVEPQPEPVLANGYYLVGDFAGEAAWAPVAERMFSANPDNEAEMVLANVALAVEDSLKVVYVENDAIVTWYPVDAPNYVVDAAHAGEKAIYFRADGQGGDDWYYHTIYIAENVEPQPDPENLWKVTESTEVAAGTVYVNNDLLKMESVYAGTLVPNERAFGDITFTHAIQVRVNAWPTTEVPAGTEQTGSTPLVITAKENATITLYYNRQAKDNAFVDNDGKDVIVYDQADLSRLNGVLTIIEINDEGTYAKVTKKVELVKGHVYTVCAKGTTIQMHGMLYEAGEAPEPLADGFYLVGTMNDWTPAAEYKFAVNPDNEAEMVLAGVNLAENAELKVRQVENGEATAWFPAEAGNYVVDAAHAGLKDIYFRADYAGAADWYAGCIYIAANSGTAIINTEAAKVAVKQLRNGMVIIRRGDREYSIMGQLVK